MYAKLSYRVLLIEDDPSDAHLVSRYLKLSTDVGFESRRNRSKLLDFGIAI